jgi:sialic acid synthase SpsE
MNSNYFNALQKCYLIAEIGVNHNGDVELAKKMILEAKESGADAVKFQTFTADSLVTINTPKVDYQKNTTLSDESHFEMIRRLELGELQHAVLFDYCASIDIDFISTPYDLESARFLDKLGVKLFKTASADIVDLPLQEYIASTGKPALVATGMANLGEVEQVVNIYNEQNNHNILLLHCVSNYPCSDIALNLRAMNTLASAFCKPVGYSDHSEGFLAAALSIALGAKVIEKHFTLDKNMTGPDHKASSTPVEFKELVWHVRRSEAMLGAAKKSMQPEEAQMASVSRKSLVLAHKINKGKIIMRDDLRLMRPGTGITASHIGTIVGRRAIRDLEALHHLKWSDIEEQV